MKEIIINTVDVIRGIDSVKEDRLDTVLAESERIEQRHKEIEDKVMELNALFS